MQKCKLGISKLEVSALGLGCCCRDLRRASKQQRHALNLEALAPPRTTHSPRFCDLPINQRGRRLKSYSA